MYDVYARYVVYASVLGALCVPCVLCMLDMLDMLGPLVVELARGPVTDHGHCYRLASCIGLRILASGLQGRHEFRPPG